MNWQPAFQDKEKTVQVTYSGVVSREELSAAARSALELSLQHGTNRGLNVRVFDKPETARQWLNERSHNTL